jgi:hypothetical protein
MMRVFSTIVGPPALPVDATETKVSTLGIIRLRHRAAAGKTMTGLHEVRFSDSIAYGATGGPEFATTVVATGSGHEKRNVNWADARGRWDVASGLKKQAQIDELIAFFRARRGRYGFRFKDWTDYKATGQAMAF